MVRRFLDGFFPVTQAAARDAANRRRSNEGGRRAGAAAPATETAPAAAARAKRALARYLRRWRRRRPHRRSAEGALAAVDTALFKPVHQQKAPYAKTTSRGCSLGSLQQ